jgi:ubiquinone/menaquinone biosynthesis C-methylase UbiE
MQNSAKLERDVERLKELLAYANPYNRSELAEPLGVPASFYSGAAIPPATLREFPDLAELAARDTAPIPAPMNRENYTGNYHFSYWLGGLRDYAMVTGLAAKHEVRSGRCFDFGGSTGRVFRHFAFQSDAWDVWSSDFNLTSVEWNLRHMPPKVKSFLNNYYPTLPIEDNYFDLVTAFSVFTHLDETEVAWLLELRRITRPGGVLMLTVMNQYGWERKSGQVLRTVQQHRPDLLAHDVLPPGKHVVSFRRDSPYRCTVFMTDEHIKDVWGRFFEIAEVIPGAHGQQTAVLLVKD